MANPETQAYADGNILIAGAITTDQKALEADTYYQGMLLEYQAAGTGVTAGTGNGTATLITAGGEVKTGAWVLTFTAALVADLEDPDGNIVAQDLTFNDGATTLMKVAGITFTITDGGTAFVATDTITMTIETAGTYLALDEGEVAAIFNGPTTVLASAGYGSVITSGEIYEGGIVDTSGDALTITEFVRASMQKNGFYLRRTA